MKKGLCAIGALVLFSSFLSCRPKARTTLGDLTRLLQVQTYKEWTQHNKTRPLRPLWPLYRKFRPPQVRGLSAPIYRKIERRVFAITKHDEASLERLARYLSKGLTGDRQKAYAIYLWITHSIAYDVVGLNAGGGISDIQEVWQKRLAICEGYARLFAYLGRLTGLRAYRIGGFAWGKDIKTLAQLKEAGHAWNVVWIEDRWFHLDSTWGAGYVGKVFTQRFKPRYFLSSPRHILGSHFAEDPRWLMLKKKLTLKQFLKRRLRFGRAWEELGLRILSQHPTPNGVKDRWTLKLQLPPSTKRQRRFLFVRWTGPFGSSRRQKILSPTSGVLERTFRFECPGQHTMSLRTRTWSEGRWTGKSRFLGHFKIQARGSLRSPNKALSGGIKPFVRPLGMRILSGLRKTLPLGGKYSFKAYALGKTSLWIRPHWYWMRSRWKRTLKTSARGGFVKEDFRFYLPGRHHLLVYGQRCSPKKLLAEVEIEVKWKKKPHCRLLVHSHEGKGRISTFSPKRCPRKGEPTLIKLRAPGATKVFVKFRREEATSLKQEEDFIFVGRIHPPRSTMARIYATFPGIGRRKIGRLFIRYR